MEHQPTGLRHIVLVEDPSGATVTSHGETRPAKPGEWYAFEALAEALTRNTGVPAVVSATLPDALEPGTALIVPARQLESRLTELTVRDPSPVMVVIDVARESILQS